MNNPCSVNCHTCGHCVWSGGEYTAGAEEIVGLPFGAMETRDVVTGTVRGVDLGDAQDLLTLWADANCTRADCVHTTAAREAARARDPELMAQRITELEALIAELAGDRPGPTGPTAR